MKTATYLTSFAGAALLAGFSVPASAAVTITGSIDKIEAHSVGDGLLINAKPIASTFSFPLDIGSPVKIDSFLSIGTSEGSVELFEDTIPKAIKVFFSFTSPFAGSDSLSGFTTGFYTPTLFGSCGVFAGGCGGVDFDTKTFTFGPNNSGSFSVDLSDAIFTTPGKATVSATFKLLSAPTEREGGGLPAPSAAAVPEPATWAMMILGFAVVGFSMRSRQRPTVRVNFA